MTTMSTRCPRPPFLPLVLLFSAATAPLAAATDLVVAPGESIQAALDLAVAGDRVLVEPGTYGETLDFGGKDVELIGLGGAAVTIVDGGGAAPVVRFTGAEGPSTRMVGLTITGGAASFGPGGVSVASGATPTISDCVIRNNTGRLGAGLNGSPTLLRCSIYDNSSTLNHGGGLAGAPTMRECVVASNTCSGADGAGMYLYGPAGSTALIEDCVIVENAAIFADSSAGGAYVDSTVQATFRRCVVAGNSASGGVFAGVGGGLRFEAGGIVEDCVVYGNVLTGSSLLGGGIYGPATVTNTIVWGNTAPALSNVGSVSWSDVQGGAAGTGNFDADPGFVAAALRDFHLTATSPCIDAGDPASTDADGSRGDVGPYAYATLYARDAAAPGAWTDPSFSSLSGTAGGRQALAVYAGPAHAGETFVALGSLSGTSPGFTTFGTHVPLVPDDYTLATLLAPASTPLVGGTGVLDAAGAAELEVVLPPATAVPPGLVAWHAVVHGSFTRPVTIAATNAVAVRVDP